MSLVDSRELLAAATRGGYAVPAFNVHFLDMIPAVVAVAEAERSPVMLQVSRATVDFVGWEDLSALAVSAARRARVPVVLHGASGVPGEALQQAIAGGIAKVNIATELKAPWAEGLRQILAERPGEIDPRRILAGALARLTAAVAGKIRLVGAQGMA